MLPESLGGTLHSRFTVLAAPDGFGAEIKGVDLRTINGDDFSSLYRTWLKHSVLIFRGQTLTDDELIAFSKHFGALDLAPIQESGRRFVEGHPEIYVVSNVMKDGVAIGSLGAGEATWHTDMSYLEQPPKASLLYALEVPPTGGNTYFCNMYRAYDSLPQELKDQMAGSRVSPPDKILFLKHDGTYNSGGYVRQGATVEDDPIRSPGAYHPLVCRHPETNRSVLYLGRRRNAYVRGLPLAESESLLDQLWSYATREEFVWHNQWRVGDLVLWDNRCTMHRRDPFEATSRRVMHRTQIKGETRPSA